VPAIVNESFIRAYFPKGNPLGRPFGDYTPDPSEDPDGTPSAGWQIVGVVRDMKYDSLRRAIEPTIYVPSAAGGSFELRTARDPLSLVPDVRAVVRQVGTDIPMVNVNTQERHIDQLLFQERLVARLSSLFGLAALLLASIGLYGLLAHEVTRGTREIGIRDRVRRAGRTGPAARGAPWRHAGGRRSGARHRGVIRGDTPTGQHALRCEARRSRNAHSGEYSADAGRTGGLLHSGAPRYPGRPAGGAPSRVGHGQSLTLDRWVEEFDQLKKRNPEIFRVGKVKAEPRKKRWRLQRRSIQFVAQFSVGRRAYAAASRLFGKPPNAFLGGFPYGFQPRSRQLPLLGFRRCGRFRLLPFFSAAHLALCAAATRARPAALIVWRFTGAA
jgi:hypothetical protein